jgi:DNA-binding response OmpR family regulator
VVQQNDSKSLKDKVLTILCIDDEEPGLLVRRAMLEASGYRVLTGLSGSQGIEVFRSEPVDCVILDYWMAGKNGLAVARELKRINRSVPIIMLSAYTYLPDETIGLVDLWVQKGGDSQQLLDNVEKLLRERPRSVAANSEAKS